MNRTNQSTIIKQAINSWMDKGLTDKQEIYSKVVEELGVPRPTVRRVARALRDEYIEKIKILQQEIPRPTSNYWSNNNCNHVGNCSCSDKGGSDNGT